MLVVTVTHSHLVTMQVSGAAPTFSPPRVMIPISLLRPVM